MTTVAYVIGAIVMAAAGGLLALAALGAVYWVVGLALHRVGKRLHRTYDLYVVEYWIKVARENGRMIPTRNDVEEFLRKEN